MAEAAYKFPDEVEDPKDAAEDKNAEPILEATPEVEIEVVDDTPPEDRNREPLPQPIVEELEKDDLEEYSTKVKQRLGQMKKVWHDERRAKEAATREREEALRVAHTYLEENRQLKQKLGAGEKMLIGEVTKAATNELAEAKNRLKQAYEAGDAELIADAQEAMTDAKLRLQEYQRYKPTLQPEETRVESNQQPQAPRQVVDPKAESWRAKNTWFGADEEMTALALGLHEKLVKQGVDVTSDDYYRTIDSTMKRRFPEYYEGETPAQEKPVVRKGGSATVVAPATRSTAPNRVRLTQTQMGLAKKFGLTPEAYAKEVIKLENPNG
jgi:hypothetical protein